MSFPLAGPADATMVLRYLDTAIALKGMANLRPHIAEKVAEEAKSERG